MTDLGSLLTAMVTPFDADLRVDEDSAVRLARHLLDHGSDGLVVCGTTGEAATLGDEEHIGLIELIAGEIGDEGTVVAGTGSNDTRHAVELTERAVEAGVDAVLSVTPYYNRPNRRGIVAHFDAVARAAAGVPVILYNIPSRTGTDMPNDLLSELAQIEGIEAVKQSRDTDVAPIDGLRLYAGNDDLLCPVLELGGAGGISVASHVIGDEMRRVIEETDPTRRRELDAALHDVYDTLFVTTSPTPVKAALNLLGHGVGGLRLPMVEADETELAAVRAMLERHGLLRGARTA